MAYWTISLPGGPKRANQVAATFGCKIYSFGEYDYQDESSPGERIFGVHVLDTGRFTFSRISDKFFSHLFINQDYNINSIGDFCNLAVSKCHFSSSFILKEVTR